MKASKDKRHAIRNHIQFCITIYHMSWYAAARAVIRCANTTGENDIFWR